MKPSNIMIDTQGRVKLVDFGIARPYIDEGDNTHVVSAGYSPPEQYWGAAEPRSDIYALGATMYFLLTGQEPLALQICSPRKTNPRVSEKTDQVVQRATAQDVWLRFQSAPEMSQDLILCSQRSAPSKQVLIAAAAGLLLMFGIGFGLIMSMNHSTEPATSTSDSSNDPLVRELESKIHQKDMLLQQKKPGALKRSPHGTFRP